MAVPVHKSSDLERSLQFYVGVLGAQVEFREPPRGNPGYAGVKWNGHALHVSSHSGDGAFGTATVFEVDDVRAVFDALVKNGYQPPTDRGPVFLGPTDQTWGTRELYVSDPDGNVLRFMQVL